MVGWVIYIAGNHCLSEVSSNPVNGQRKPPVFFRRWFGGVQGLNHYTSLIHFLDV